MFSTTCRLQIAPKKRLETSGSRRFYNLDHFCTSPVCPPQVHHLLPADSPYTPLRAVGTKALKRRSMTACGSATSGFLTISADHTCKHYLLDYTDSTGALRRFSDLHLHHRRYSKIELTKKHMEVQKQTSKQQQNQQNETIK